MEFKDLQKVNKNLPQIDFKGKGYVEVNKRVMAFRELFPNGAIDTHIVSVNDGVCIVQTKVYDENGKLLSSGLAYEKESSSYINKTSYIENCETSSVGRALGFLGIGVDTSIASFDEVDTAVRNQEQIKFEEQSEKQGQEEVTPAQKKGLVQKCESLEQNWETVLVTVGWNKGEKLTKKQYGEAMNILIDMEKKNAKVKK